MVVSLLVVFVLLRVFTTATTSWQRGEAQVDAYREARGALLFMARDLSTVVHPVVTKVDGGSTYPQPPSTYPPPPLSTYPQPLLPTLALAHYASYLAAEPPHGSDEDLVNEEVYCLTNIVNSTTPATPGAAPSPGANPTPAPMPSETCAVGYFCQWMPALANPNDPNAQKRAPHAFSLMRQFLNSDGVFQRMKALPSNGAPLTFGQLFTRNSLMPGAAPTTNPSAATSTPLAAYIWDLKFRLDTNLADKTDGTPTHAPTDHGDPNGNAADPTKKQRVYDGATLPYPGVLPPYVEIRFKALSTGAGRRLEGNTNIQPSDWRETSSATYRTLILPNARQFVLRVPLLNSNPLPNP